MTFIQTYFTGKAWLTALLFCSALAVLAILADLPSPGPDDLFYVGPALNLAMHGELRTDLLANQGFLSKDFLIYPPFYQYLLGAWLRLTGISTLSIHVFTHVSYLLGAFGMSFLLARAKVFGAISPLWPALFYLATLCSLGWCGFRGDALGFSVLVMGFCLSFEHGFWHRLLAWFLIGASLLISPNVLPYAALLRLLLLLLDGRTWMTRLREETAPLVLGVLMNFLLMTWSIGGRWSEFSRAFLHHATRAVLPFSEALLRGTLRFINEFRVLPFTVLTLVLCLSALLFLRDRKKAFSTPAFRVALALITWLVAGLLSIGMTWIRIELRVYTLLLAGLVSGLWLVKVKRTRLFGVFGLSALALACLWMRDFIAPRWSSDLRPNPEHIAAARKAVADEPGRCFFIDSYSARCVFDYNLPDKAIDWFFSQPFPGIYPQDLSALKADQTWIISGINLRLCAPSTGQFKSYLKIGPVNIMRFGRDYDIFVIDGRMPVQEQLKP